MKHHQKSMKSRFTALENHFLNTFFSGIYISAKEFLEVAKKVGLDVSMNSRELLIKELLNKSDEKGSLEQTIALLNALLQQRVEKYNELSRDYPGANIPLAQLSQKAKATKSLLAQKTQRSPYELS